MGETWGISGPAFLLFYVVLAVVVLIASIRAPTRGHAGGRRGAGHRDPHPPARRRLPQRRRRAGAGLRAHRAAAARRRSGRSAATRRPYRARTPGTTSWSAPSTPPWRRPPPQVDREQPLGGRRARATERRLIDAGLLLSDAQRRRIRGTGWWMLAVAGLGLLRLLAGIANARPVGWLVVAFIAVTIVAVILLASAPRRTQRGDRTLAALRDENHTLAPKERPDWALYGPVGAALGIGLFGMSAVWASDPAIAGELAVQRMNAGAAAERAELLGRGLGWLVVRGRQQLRGWRLRRRWRVRWLTWTSHAAAHRPRSGGARRRRWGDRRRGRPGGVGEGSRRRWGSTAAWGAPPPGPTGRRRPGGSTTARHPEAVRWRR